MNVTLVLAHPDPRSFNHAIAQTAADTLRALGHTVAVHDLYAANFDSVMTAGEIGPGSTAPAEIAALGREVAAADGLLFVHPNWWGMPPAILTGWIDRVLRAGVAYKFVPGDKGEGVPVGLLRARTAIVFNTSNTPAAREAAVFGDPLDAIWRKCVFGLCAVPRVERRNFAVVVTSTPAQRAAWLEEVRTLVRDCFPAGQ